LIENAFFDFIPLNGIKETILIGEGEWDFD
jgi:hypothetical protein